MALNNNSAAPNPISFSVVIPARDPGKVLEDVLLAVQGSLAYPDEVIVVDDGSTDSTAFILSHFLCEVVTINVGQGPMQARFAGAKKARGEVLVFIDADVRVMPDTFSKILRHFEDPSIHAVSGLLSAESGSRSFFTVFKNEYMNFIFKRQPADSRFLYGSVWAIRRRDFIYFEPISEPFGSLVSDSEMGFRLRQQNKRILFDPSLECVHLKEYSFCRLIRNDFVIPFMFALMWRRYGDFGNVRRTGRFSHASLGQVLAAGAAFLAFAAGSSLLARPSFVQRALFLAFMAWVYIYWAEFIQVLRKRRGWLFTFKTILFIPLDGLAMFCGMSAGFIYAFMRPYGKERGNGKPAEGREYAA